MEYTDLRKLHTQLLFLNTDVIPQPPSVSEVSKAIQLLTNGQYIKFVSTPYFQDRIFANSEIQEHVNSYIGSHDIKALIENISQSIISNLDSEPTTVLTIAVLFLQMFIQSNFTGPKLPLDPELGLPQLGFLNSLMLESRNNPTFKTQLQSQSLQLLSVSGQNAYRLLDSPILLLLSLRLLELIQRSPISLLEPSTLTADEVVEKSGVLSTFDPSSDLVIASICWWRARALQVQQSLFPEENSILTSLSFRLLTGQVASCFIDNSDVNNVTNQAVLVSYYLESSRNALAGNTESLSIESLAKAKKCSGLQFIMTGCKAKRTKFQQKSVAALTVLAKSQDGLTRLLSNESGTVGVGEVDLNDDLFLERLQYDSVGDSAIFEQQEQQDNADDIKRVKIDYSSFDAYNNVDDDDFEKKLLPVAHREDAIPEELSKLDPNNQPTLSNLDNIQLLLRLETIRENSPASNQLVNEELISLVQRVLFTPLDDKSSASSINWLIFSRALWLRSLLEATRSKTVERGVLQLYSLVEELGITSEQTARLFPKSKDEESFPVDFLDSSIPDSKPLPNSIRSRYIHSLPLMPKWSMDTTLAAKLIELGSLKSAIEIYERLEEWTDAALCYASTGNEAKAEELIRHQLSIEPNDARAISILGDIKQDPELWEQAWKIGRYASAKKSLAKYYYNPPASSGLKRDYTAAIKHQYDCLSVNPINFENWYFYGCLGLEVQDHELAAEAFTRCVAIDETNSYAWSNLASSLMKLDRIKEAFGALKKAVNSGDDGSKSWKIWENYLVVAVKVGNWDDVLFASRVLLNTKKDIEGEGSLDIPILEKLVDLLVSEPYNEDTRQTHFQKSCIDFVCNMVPTVVNHNSRCWRIIAKVNFWRGKPWLALDDYEKAYRAVVNMPDLTSDEDVWNDAVEACFELVSAYENFGEMPGKYGAGDVVCKDWKFKAKSSVRSLISKGKAMWEDSDGYERLQELKKEVMNN
ncbi:hypothetical protein CANARDRAFT_28258 [[Candida] arabinofermentans NRRL YB-2248]|uniref:Uncharacterized protein n=1 Tax=[Candida] arabinofermentans NRRL YB-2248 TaxID=983967 RepID=A0A1E4T181_9ASCO|nr:hypothetical protein CANARDRAFT_28258 [[Candida] arabinofermentans NRRL YB-2248]